MKRLPLWQRLLGAKKVLEGGSGGHERLLPRAVKTTNLHFRDGVWIQEHKSFAAAAEAGFFAYEPSLALLRRNISFPVSLRAYRFRKLRSLMKAHHLL
jgi:hypothetical protein